MMLPNVWPFSFVTFMLRKSSLFPDQMNTHLYSPLVVRGTFTDLAPFYFFWASLFQPPSSPSPCGEHNLSSMEAKAIN